MEKISGMSHVTSFDHGIVRYEEIHDVQPEDFAVLTDAGRRSGLLPHFGLRMRLRRGHLGNPSRTEEQRKRKGQLIAIDLVDESEEQLEKEARED